MYKIFKNRTEAAKLLVEKLKKRDTTNAVVLAVPRGGVPVGYEIAKSLHLPLDIFLSKKIGHPYNPEYAIGSVTLEGAVLNGRAANIDLAYIKAQTEKIREQLRERYKKFRGDRPPLDVTGKTVILTDDGVATGNTLFAAIEDLRKKVPARIIVAVPVSPPETAKKLRRLADELICLFTPDDFYGVGQYYEDFGQVEDTEVQALMEKAGEKVDANE
ncbi:MAG: phosphoribosyltransferase [Thermoanaerobaculia bacterium]|nr:phosphoribosyltransferase [Thermoanaerobaculia bacterium]